MDTISSIRDDHTMRDLSVPVTEASAPTKDPPASKKPVNGTGEHENGREEMVDPATYIQTPGGGILSPRDDAGAEIGMDFKLTELDPETFVERGE
jgi:hypothetical protein